MEVNSKLTILIMALIFLFTKGQCQSKVFYLDHYGAVKGGKVDNAKALLKAWGEACKWKGESKLVIPSGTYLVSPVQLTGPCKGPIEFQNSGILKAPLGLRGVFWIQFQYINGLTLTGGGTFDGQGPPKQAAPNLPTLMMLDFVTNSRVQDVKLINSQSTHITLFGCKNIELNKISISSPGDSPNTDGIKIGQSNAITISDSHVASGDDCVALLTGSHNISLDGVNCGPGHGISIGSMGGSPNEHVDQILVKNCSLVGTTNGLRIKTKATNYPGIVTNVQYEDIFMDGVENPIIFDPNYCPPNNCGKGTSNVQVTDVRFTNIYGTSKTPIAVNLQCSQNNPCQKIELTDIKLSSQGSKGATIAKCSHVSGQAQGTQMPQSCIKT